jgi:hypothetical protein
VSLAKRFGMPLLGWAYSGGGSWVERVEISIDGGFIWNEVSNWLMAREVTKK